MRAIMPVYHNPHDYPRSRQVSYTWAMIFAFVFGFFFWFHTTRWRILLVYLIAIIAVWFIPYFGVFWPTIFAGMNAYFAMMAPRICHEDGSILATGLLTLVTISSPTRTLTS